MNQLHDEQEQRPGDERSANNRGGFMRDQQSTVNPNHEFGWRDEGGRKRNWGISMLERPWIHMWLATELRGGAQTKSRESRTRDCESTHVFGRRGGLGRKQIRQVCAGEANLRWCLAKLIGGKHKHQSLLLKKEYKQKSFVWWIIAWMGGHRHGRQATLLNCGRAKGRSKSDAMLHQPCQKSLNDRFFCWESDSLWRQHLEQLTRSATFERKNPTRERLWWIRVHGAPLKRGDERIDCVSRAII